MNQQLQQASKAQLQELLNQVKNNNTAFTKAWQLKTEGLIQSALKGKRSISSIHAELAQTGVAVMEASRVNQEILLEYANEFQQVCQALENLFQQLENAVTSPEQKKFIDALLKDSPLQTFKTAGIST